MMELMQQLKLITNKQTFLQNVCKYNSEARLRTDFLGLKINRFLMSSTESFPTTETREQGDTYMAAPTVYKNAPSFCKLSVRYLSY